MAASFESTVFGTMPLASDHPRYKDWVTVCRRAEEEDAKLLARFLKGDQGDDRVFLDFFSDWFDIRAKWWTIFHVRSYDSAKFNEQMLAMMSKAVLSLANEKCPMALRKRIHTELEVRIAQRSAHWKHEALRLAREAESDAANPNLDAPGPTTIERPVLSGRVEPVGHARKATGPDVSKSQRETVEPVGRKVDAASAEPAQPSDAPSDVGTAQEEPSSFLPFDVNAQDLETKEGRRKAVDAFLLDCNRTSQQRILKKHIWTLLS